MKSFTINLGRNHELINESGNLNEVTGNADACVKGYFKNTTFDDDSIEATLFINADILKEYFADVTGEAVDSVEAVIVNVDGIAHVAITPSLTS